MMMIDVLRNQPSWFSAARMLTLAPPLQRHGECEDWFENVRVFLDSSCAADFPEHKCSD